MTTKRFRYAPLRVIALAFPALALLAIACEAHLPTTADIETMDVAAAEEQAERIRIVERALDRRTVYFVDDEEASAEEARGITSDRIARIEVVRKGSEDRTEIHLLTREEGASGDEEGVTFVPRDREYRIRATQEALAEPLFIVDGTEVEASAFRSLSPEMIESVEVIKGAAAVRMYDDPAARNGVVRIETKDGTER